MQHAARVRRRPLRPVSGEGPVHFASTGVFAVPYDQEEAVMVKSTARLITSGIFVLLTAALIALATLLPDFFFSFYPALSRKLISVLAAATAPFPFAVWELLAAALVVWLLVSLVLAIRRKRVVRWLTGVLLGICLGVFLFVGLWGLNHFGPGIDEKLGLTVRDSSAEELREATEYYLSAANGLCTKVPRDDDGLFQPGDFETLANQAADGYRVLAKQYDTFNGSTVRVKKLASSALFGKMSLTGIFVDFTGESCVSTTTFANSLPFTMCHEIGHRMGLAGEDEANFAAFLACDASTSAVFRYSGYYEAFVYCFNALYDADPTAAAEVWETAAPYIQSDYSAAYRHYEAISDATATKVSDAVNDTYLKAFSEKSGVRSYGEVVDLLLAWYAARVA